MASALRKLFLPKPEPTSPEGSSHDASTIAEGSAEPDSKAPAEAAITPSPVEEQQPNEHAQDGVTQAEAITLVWTKTSLGAAYILQVPHPA
ncbi:siderophore iron transporter mirb [Diplodia corticola]|uniref:Siderophore iron transporter mirb n=1 Tax=Diplodia corticola TaxID=236234 RepID=A0A1J9RLH3_9PEZI|nr:siderophore iron transporter mirb [Diplodia corticola]OJD28772.1 siderophore iron transporter mirb [Diplodia corticola]